MTKNYIIDLEPNDEFEDYEKENSNLAMVTVDVKNDPSSPPRGEGYRIRFSLSSSAMIGLGTALIRHGLSAQGHGNLELDSEPILPIVNDMPDYAEMGIYLMPGSADLMFFLAEFGTIDKVIESIKEKK